MFLVKGVMKICSKFTGENPWPKCDFNKVAKQISMNLLSPAQHSWRRKGAIFQV